MPVPSLGVLVRDALDALLPERCVACGRFGAALHIECLDALERAAPPRCERCWLPDERRFCARCEAEPPAFAGLRAPYRFTGIVHRAVLEAKFRGVTRLLPPLAQAAAGVVPALWGIEAVVPVPLHRARQRRRGYNQAALLAREVAAALGARYEQPLHRVRATAAQAGLSARQRARNVERAFASAPIGGTVLVIDDVATTGATFEAAARALLDAGAERVYALSIARED